MYFESSAFLSLIITVVVSIAVRWFFRITRDLDSDRDCDNDLDLDRDLNRDLDCDDGGSKQPHEDESYLRDFHPKFVLTTERMDGDNELRWDDAHSLPNSLIVLVGPSPVVPLHSSQLWRFTPCHSMLGRSNKDERCNVVNAKKSYWHVEHAYYEHTERCIELLERVGRTTLTTKCYLCCTSVSEQQLLSSSWYGFPDSMVLYACNLCTKSAKLCID